MITLDDVLKSIAANPGKGLFVSRSGTDKQKELALWIAATLKAHGYIPVLQDATSSMPISCWRWTRRWRAAPTVSRRPAPRPKR